MKLPASLAQWATELNIFPEEVSHALAPIVVRISLLIGALSSRFTHHEGEPDGFSGLARSGAYERLLLSEWLLADEVPEEFLRRAAMGEHLFLHRARTSRAGSRSSLVLLDAGPNQLGTPRIAQLAALIVLARRAASASATFGWGVLQDGEQRIFPDVTPGNILQMLAARSPTEATDEQLAGWRRRLAEWSTLDDAWLVGGARLARLPAAGGFSLLSIQDTLDPAARRLDLALRSASGVRRELELELPESGVATRLLRDPFEVTTPEVQKVESERRTPISSSLVFSADGTKLFSRYERWGVIAYNVPNSPRGGTGKPRRFRTHQWKSVAAVGKLERAVTLITAEENFIRFEHNGRRPLRFSVGNYEIRNQGIAFTMPADDGELLPCFSFGKTKDVVVLDAAGVLFHLSPLSSPPPFKERGSVVGTAQVMATEVASVAYLNSRLVYVGREWPGESTHIVVIGEEITRYPLPSDVRARKAFLTYSFPAQPYMRDYTDTHTTLAAEQEEGRWVIADKRGLFRLRLDAGARAVGLVLNPHVGSEPALVVLEEDRRTVKLYGGNWRTRLLESGSKIEHVSVYPNAPYVAYATEAGETIVYSLQHRTDLCRYQREEKE